MMMKLGMQTVYLDCNKFTFKDKHEKVVIISSNNHIIDLINNLICTNSVDIINMSSTEKISQAGIKSRLSY